MRHAKIKHTCQIFWESQSMHRWRTREMGAGAHTNETPPRTREIFPPAYCGSKHLLGMFSSHGNGYVQALTHGCFPAKFPHIPLQINPDLLPSWTSSSVGLFWCPGAGDGICGRHWGGTSVSALYSETRRATPRSGRDLHDPKIAAGSQEGDGFAG